MRFEADDDEILRWKFPRIVGAARMNHVLLVADQEFQAVCAHRGKMSSSRHETDICARAGKLDPEISADRTGAVNTDLQETAFLKLVEKSARVLAWPGNEFQGLGNLWRKKSGRQAAACSVIAC